MCILSTMGNVTNAERMDRSPIHRPTKECSHVQLVTSPACSLILLFSSSTECDFSRSFKWTDSISTCIWSLQIRTCLYKKQCSLHVSLCILNCVCICTHQCDVCVCVHGSAIQRPEEILPVGACLLTHLRWVLLLLISGYALLVGLWTCRDCLYLHLMFAILGWQVYVQIYMALEVLSSGLHACPVSVFTTAPPS